MTYQLPIRVNKGTGEAILLLHGLGNNCKSWTHVLKLLDYTKNRVYAIDLLGFGSAQKPVSVNYTLDDHADAVIATMDTAGISKAVIAGHSMGCLVAVAVATKRPDLAARLVLLGAPTFRHMPRRRDRLFFWRKEDAYSKLFTFIAKQPDATVKVAKLIPKLIPLIKGMQVTEKTWPAFRKSLKRTIIQTDSYQQMLKIQTPTLVVYGLLDFFVIKRNLKTIARRNKKFVTYMTMVGPHEITPIQGKQICEFLQA
jgi:pimeloyl-ACP methyl ester carboxylesterase